MSLQCKCVRHRLHWMIHLHKPCKQTELFIPVLHWCLWCTWTLSTCTVKHYFIFFNTLFWFTLHTRPIYNTYYTVTSTNPITAVIQLQITAEITINNSSTTTCTNTLRPNIVTLLSTLPDSDERFTLMRYKEEVDEPY